MAQPLSHRRWQNYRAHILATHPPICCICQQPIDLTIRHPDPHSPTVHHIEPVAQAPHRIYDPTNTRPAHKVCNERQGTRPPTQPSRTW